MWVERNRRREKDDGHAARFLTYRVTQKVSDMGWVELDLICMSFSLGSSGPPVRGTPQI